MDWMDWITEGILFYTYNTHIRSEWTKSFLQTFCCCYCQRKKKKFIDQKTWFFFKINEKKKVYRATQNAHFINEIFGIAEKVVNTTVAS